MLPWAFVQLCVIVFLSFCWRDISDWLQQSFVVEPIDPFQCCKLDSLEGSPRATPVDHLSLVKAVDGFGQSIVIAVTDAANRRFDASFGQSLGIFYGYILATPVAVVNKSALMNRPSFVQSLLQGIQHKVCMCRSADTPTDNVACKHIDHKGDINEALPCRNIGKIRQTVRRKKELRPRTKRKGRG